MLEELFSYDSFSLVHYDCCLNIFSFRIHWLGNTGHLWFYVDVSRHRTSMHQGGLWFFTSTREAVSVFCLFRKWNTEMDITFFGLRQLRKPRCISGNLIYSCIWTNGHYTVHTSHFFLCLPTGLSWTISWAIPWTISLTESSLGSSDSCKDRSLISLVSSQ